MSRLVKIGLYGTYLWFIATAIIKLFQVNEQNYAIQLRDRNHIIPGIFFLIMGLIAMVMAIQLQIRIKKKYSFVTSTLIYFFLVSMGGGLLQGIFGIIEFQVRAIQVIWTDSAFFFIVSASFAMTLFILDVFTKGISEPENKKYILTMGIVVLASMFFLSKKMLAEASDVEVYVPVLFLFVLTLYIFLLLAKKSLELRHRVETNVEKSAFLLIAISGICLTFGFIGVLAFTLTQIEPVRYINSISFSIGYVLLYLGFTLPANQ